MDTFHAVLVDEFSTLVIDLDLEAAMPAHHIVEKLSSSKLFCPLIALPLTTFWNSQNNKVATTINSGSPHKATPNFFKTFKGTGMLWLSALNPIVSDNFRKS